MCPESEETLSQYHPKSQDHYLSRSEKEKSLNNYGKKPQ